MNIVKNRICYTTHNVVCDPDCADAEYMVAMADSLTPHARPAVHRKELYNMNNDGTWTIELPIVHLENFWASESAERRGAVPTRILARVSLHNGLYDHTIFVGHCARSESFQPLWKRMYQQGIKIGKAQRRVAEAKYFAEYDKAVAEHAARTYEDPACSI
jgi:hypothetical protein